MDLPRSYASTLIKILQKTDLSHLNNVYDVLYMF